MRPQQAMSLAAASVLMLGLASCAPESGASDERTASPSSSRESEPSQKPSSEPAPTEEPAPETEPTPVVIPECEQLVPIDVVHEKLGPAFVFTPESGPFRDMLLGAVGPSAQEAISRAEQTSFCSWGIPQSDGLNLLMVAELPADARDAFLAELRASEFVETETAGSPTFVWEDEPGLSQRFLWYGFTGDLLVISVGASADGGVGVPALASLQAAT